ncbi:sensor histidine kinase [Peristeroidobacter soli]|uniref:sensor histidine kinase n=1 Tax=Peristeroidobacter soli TaxID=2497877 RepID=UPI00158E1884|nr:ATP-binding protein [Peristeroidobacter soli]
MSISEDLLLAQRRLQQLQAQLETQVAATNQVSAALELRNAALNASTTHFMIVDARQSRRPIVYVNWALALAHGYRHPEDLIGRSVTVIADRILDPATRDQLRRTLDEGRPAALETQFARDDGSTFWAGFTTTPLRNEAGEITHYVTLGADISARRERDDMERALQRRLQMEMSERERVEVELRLAQKLESIGRFAAGLAHEINTPIQYVADSVHFLQSAFADLASLLQEYRAAAHDPRSASSADARDRLTALETACDLDFLSEEVPKAFVRSLEGTERVASIVRAMREFAYPHGEEHVAADLNHAIATTLTVARSEYKYAAHIDLQLGELPAVVCNLGELNQVFLNLIVNAAHAIQDSDKDACTGRITITTRALGERVEIAIADNGCGIAPENLDKIFDPFYTTKEVGRGTGQGLAIARSIVVDKHGGRIEVSSTLDIGTRFAVLLPVRGREGKVAA